MTLKVNYTPCLIAYVLAHIFGVLAIIFVVLWIDFNGEGFSLDHSSAPNIFKFHPLFMTLGLFFLNGEALMIYRGLRYLPKKVTKAAHAGMHTVAFGCMVFALKTAWDSHDYNRRDGKLAPIPHLLSSHSWIGLLTSTLYGLQWAGGLLTYYFPGTPMSARKAVMPYHRATGIFIFAFTLGALLMGVGEKTAWSLHCEPYGVICKENAYVNVFALFIVFYAACVLLIATRSDWIRQPLPEELPYPAPQYTSSTITTSNNHSSTEVYRTQM